MTTLTINSRKLDRAFTFFMPDGGGYVRLENGRDHGTLGAEICHGGGFRGETIYCSDAADFNAACRKWYRAHIRDADALT